MPPKVNRAIKLPAKDPVAQRLRILEEIRAYHAIAAKGQPEHAFTSEQFDAEAVLRPGVKVAIPVPSAALRDNVYQCSPMVENPLEVTKRDIPVPKEKPKGACSLRSRRSVLRPVRSRGVTTCNPIVRWGRFTLAESPGREADEGRTVCFGPHQAHGQHLEHWAPG